MGIGAVKFMTKTDICPNFPIINCNKFMMGVFL